MCVYYQALRILGGVIKKHLKKDDAVKALKLRAASPLKKTEDLDVNIQFPNEFKTFLDNADKTAQDIMLMKAQGTMVVQAGLRTMSDDNLKTLNEIMDNSGRDGRRGSSEERVLKAVSVMFPMMVLLENSKIAISNVQMNCVRKPMLNRYYLNLQKNVIDKSIIENGANGVELLSFCFFI